MMRKEKAPAWPYIAQLPAIRCAGREPLPQTPATRRPFSHCPLSRSDPLPADCPSQPKTLRNRPFLAETATPLALQEAARDGSSTWPHIRATVGQGCQPASPSLKTRIAKVGIPPSQQLRLQLSSSLDVVLALTEVRTLHLYVPCRCPRQG